MPRQLLLLAKVVPGVDAELDSLAARLSHALDLRTFVDPKLSGRGLLYWSSWYDPWLMGCDLCPNIWPLNVKGSEVTNEIWELELSADWTSIVDLIGIDHQWQEQTWLPWQLWQAYTAFKDCNDRAVLYYGRAIIGASLSDDELL